ncbi:MAG: hypothetical protein V8S95_02755 [Odoribacter sp.]
MDGEKLNIGFHGEVHLKSGEKLKAAKLLSLQKIELSGACRLEGKVDLAEERCSLNLRVPPKFK